MEFSAENVGFLNRVSEWAIGGIAWQYYFLRD
jgi:hypothetical protein